MTTILNEDQNWKLKSLNIELNGYGDYVGKYTGKVRFENRENEAFIFSLSPEDTQKYINLVSEKLVDSASHLGNKLLASLNLLPAPKVIAIEAKEEANEIS